MTGANGVVLTTKTYSVTSGLYGGATNVEQVKEGALGKWMKN